MRWKKIALKKKASTSMHKSGHVPYMELLGERGTACTILQAAACTLLQAAGSSKPGGAGDQNGPCAIWPKTPLKRAQNARNGQGPKHGPCAILQRAGLAGLAYFRCIFGIFSVPAFVFAFQQDVARRARKRRTCWHDAAAKDLARRASAGFTTDPSDHAMGHITDP